MSEQTEAAWPIVVFTDGAAKGNPGPGGWGVVVVTPDGQVTELGGRADHSTNNRMELTGAINGLAECQAVAGPVAVYTDSTYVIQGIRQWIWGWRSRGWRTSTGTEVLNRDLWERLSTLVDARGKGGIAWHYVRGHIGTPGNERVDEIADGLAQRQDIQLYRGPLSGYPLPILELPEDTDVPAAARRVILERRRQGGALLPQRRRRHGDAARDVGRVRAAREGALGGALQEGDEPERGNSHPARLEHRSGERVRQRSQLDDGDAVVGRVEAERADRRQGAELAVQRAAKPAAAAAVNHPEASMAGQDRGVDGRHDAIERLRDDQAVQVEVDRGSGPVAIVVSAGPDRSGAPGVASIPMADR